MNQSFSLASAASFLAKTFDDYAGGRSEVLFLGGDSQGRMVVAVRWEGDELVRAMQVKDFLVKQGDTIVHSIQRKAGKTLLVYKIKLKDETAAP